MVGRVWQKKRESKVNAIEMRAKQSSMCGDCIKDRMPNSVVNMMVSKMM